MREDTAGVVGKFFGHEVNIYDYGHYWTREPVLDISSQHDVVDKSRGSYISANIKAGMYN
jgi:hypothetical protein